jgi:hypothetical protein
VKNKRTSISISSAPRLSYGVLEREMSETWIDIAIEEIRRLGFTIISSGYSPEEIGQISDAFQALHQSYQKEFFLFMSGPEKNIIRAPLLVEDPPSIFLSLALNRNVIQILKRTLHGRFILNQQNGIINPPNESYSQGLWHRDLPYQHFVSSRPLAINALYCVDDFTIENGATFVLAGSHKESSFPSEAFVQKNSTQVEAPRGSFILLDCMVFHSGGFNRSNLCRRGVNHVYNIPYIKQQINIPKNAKFKPSNKLEEEILGFCDIEPESIMQFFDYRLSNDGTPK